MRVRGRSGSWVARAGDSAGKFTHPSIACSVDTARGPFQASPSPAATGHWP